MPIEFDINTLDPLFSQKLLDAEVISEAEKDLMARIETLYASLDIKTGIYYEGSALGSEIEAFTNSEDFSYLKQQLEICFEQLVAFCDAQEITLPSGEGSVEASRLLQTFLDKLKTDFFSDRRALLYGPGKKYIETLAAFIHEPRIDLDFRILQIINLLSDEGLTHSCAEGCFTRLQYAADNLKNYNNFEIPTLYKNYLQFLSDEIIHRPVILGGEDTITKKVAKWMKLEPIGFEIHIRNFILKKIKERFNLKSLEPVQDEYVNTIENFFSGNNEKKRLLENNFQYLIKSFNKRSTATNFIKYLSTLIQKSFSTHVDYMERSKFLEEKALESFGRDSKFSLAEVLSEETGLLKDEHCLDITITERLMNAGWLTSDWSKYLNNPLFRARNPQWSSLNPPFPVLTDRYKLYYGNLPLGWISVDSERQKIMSVLQQEQGLNVVKTIHANPTELLNTLIQTPDDLAFFFNQLAPSQQENALNWIGSVPNFVENVLGYYSQIPVTYDLLEPLLSFLSQLESQHLKKGYATEFKLKERLQSRIEKLSKDNNVVASVCTGLIKTTCSLRTIDFSDFIFYKNMDPLKPHSSYLLKIDFSKMSMNNVRFYEGVYSCSFTSGEIDNTFFYGRVFSTDFTLSTLSDTSFDGQIEQSFFNTAKLFKVSFQKVLQTNFISAILTGIEFKKMLSACNFSKAKVTTSIFLQQAFEINFHGAKLENIIFNAEVSLSQFKVAILKNVEFYESVKQGLFSPTDLFQVDFFASIIECKFNLSTLNKVNFHKKIFRSFFSNANLRHVVFESEIFGSIFDSASGIEVEFRKSLKNVNFLNLSLMTGKFVGEIEDCDFSDANLSKVNFLNEIINVKFNNALLNQVLFNFNLKKCDFIASKLYANNFHYSHLIDINFVNAVLLQVHFLESYISRSQFTFSNLIHAKFENSILELVSFNKANLEGAIFKNIQFKVQVDFIETNLRNADFSNCDLTLINFQGSNVKYVKLKESIITPQQLFDTFYNTGVKDFSEVTLSEQGISKSDFLLIYAEKSLEEAILSDSVFKGLIKLGYRNFAKTDLTNLKMNEFIHLYTNIEYNFSEAVVPQIFLAPKPNVDVEHQSLSLRDCLPKESRNKRAIQSCDIHWSDIDSFNLNVADNRNFEEIIIDQTIFTDTLFSTRDPKKLAKLVELIDIMDTNGEAALALRELRTTQQLKQHFYRVGNLCNALQQGLIYENIVMDFIHEDYRDVAMNIGLLTGSHLSENFAEQVLIISKKLSISKRVFLSKLLKFSAPFLRRGLTTGYIVYDLIKQAQALADDNKYTLNNILQDSFLITFDVMEAGIEVLDFSQISKEIADLIKSTGAIVNTLILGGAQAYQSARSVAEIKALIPLSPLQTFIEGIEAFLNINPSQNIQRQLEYNLAYAIYSQKIKDFLKKFPTVKYYIVPIIDLVGEYSQYKICGLSHGYPYMCNRAVHTHLEIKLDSMVYLKKEAQSGLLFNPLNPLKNHFKPEEIFCNPYRINLNAYIEGLTCDSAFVILNPWSDDVHNQTLIALEGGYDTVYSFSDSPSIFIVDDGYKVYVGGTDNDRFVVKDSSVKGRLDASSGSDLLDLRFYEADNQVLIIDLVNQILTASESKILTIRNFERILGRSHQKDLLFVTHRTEFIDLQGGLELAHDEIIIAPYISNPHLEMIVRPETVINNFAISGNFIYRVLGVEKYSDASANSTNHSVLFFANYTSMINHTLLFDYDLDDLNSIEINQEIDVYDLRFNFEWDENNPLANHSVTLKNCPIPAHYYFKDNTRLKIGQKFNLYAFQTSSLPVSNLIERYAPLASRLGITFFIHQSLNNEVVVIGHTNHQVLKNDLFASKSHLVANGGCNSYVIISDKRDTRIPISDVILYQLTTDETQHVLDLRELYKEFMDAVLQHSRLDIVVITIENDLQLSLLYKSLLEDSEQVFNQTSVVNVLLKQGTQWYRKLTVLFNRTPLQLVEVEPNLWQLHPQPLNFEASVENIILTNNDIEKDNQIFLHRPIHQHHWLRDGSDVWLTTLFTATSYLNRNYTILFKDFEHHAKMRTLRLIFSNTTLLLSDCVEEIAQAEDFHKKLTSLELMAWNEVSKHRTAGGGRQEYLPPIQSKVLDHREFYRPKIITAKSMTSSAIRAEGWLNFLVKMFKEMAQDFLPKTSQSTQTIFPLMAVKEAKANKSFELNRCTLGVQYGNTVREGITCFTEKMQMFIFPKNEHGKLATLKDNYSKQQFRPVECNGRPAVYFEGEKTHIFYIPEIPENPLDRLNDQLILLQVLFHEGKKWYGWCKNFFREKTKQPQLLSKESAKTIITNDIKISWKGSLDDIEKQLNDIKTVAGETVDWRWINNILEDRREELDVMTHSSKVNLETINTFTENLQALQAELVEISKDFALTVKQGGEFVCQTHNANRLTYKHYESNVLLSCNTNTPVIPCGFFKGQCFKKEYNDNHKFYLSNNLL